MGFVVNKDFTAAMALVTSWLRETKNVPVTSGKVREAERAEARKEGFTKGLMDGLAEVLTEARVARFPYLNGSLTEGFWPKVNAWDCEKALRFYCYDLYVKLLEQGISSERKTEVNNALGNSIDLTLDSLVRYGSLKSTRHGVGPESYEWEGDYAHLNETARRNLVIEGKVDPTPDDADWIQELIDTKKKEVAPLDQLLSKTYLLSAGE